MPTLATARPVTFDDENSVNHRRPQYLSKTRNHHHHKRWSTAASSTLYQLDSWGSPYFSANSRGHVSVKLPPGLKPSHPIDLVHVISTIQSELGLSTPVILRFPDLLRHRLLTLQAAFDAAIKSQCYRSHFQGVYPVKCNQDRTVVETLVSAGQGCHFGLEAGSKPELLLAMSVLSSHGSDSSLLVCNGYKDSEYIALALLARRIGLNSVIVLEQEEELDTVLKLGSLLRIDPVIGLRAKLNTKHAGHFGETSGEKGKFGLSCAEIVSVVNKLRRARKLHCLQLLHFHIGSQIPSLAVLNDGVSEAAHIYCELALMGANMRIIDIGGGLGVDYDGSKSPESDMSIGYSVSQYAAEVVKAVTDACSMKGIKQPILCSESGRALVSHHSVLVFDVVSSTSKTSSSMMMSSKGISFKEVMDSLPAELKALLSSLLDHVRNNERDNALECARQLKSSCTVLFKHGQFSLAQLASINSIFDMVSESAAAEADDSDGNERLGHKAVYHMNLSIFKSMPDTWAIEQLFPIVPLQRLDEEPTVRAILSDLTCDSDGKIDTFVGTDSQGRRQKYLKLHPLEEGKPYYMGMFLGGAYQEALGGIHNLFGSPNVVTVTRDGTNNGFKVSKAADGQTSADVLRVMQFDPVEMMQSLKLQIHQHLNLKFNLTHDDDDEEDEADPTGLIHTLASSFASSTYLTTNNSITIRNGHKEPVNYSTTITPKPKNIFTSKNNPSMAMPTTRRVLLPT